MLARTARPSLSSRAVLVTLLAGAVMTVLHLAGRAAHAGIDVPLAFVEQAAIFLALVFAFRASVRGPEDLRPVFRRIAVGLSFTVVASTISEAVALATGSRPMSPTVLDAVYLAAYPFYVAAILRLPRRAHHVGLRDVLDGLAAGTLLGLAAGRYVVEPIVSATRVGPGAIAVNVFFVAADLALLWVILAVFTSSKALRQAWVGILAAGMTVLVSGDMWFLSLSARGPVPRGSLVFLLFLWGFLLVSLGAWEATRAGSAPGPDEGSGDAEDANEWELPSFQVLPFVLLLGVVGLVGVEAASAHPRLYVVLGGLGVAILLGVRQVLTLTENRALLARERDVVYRLRELDRMRADFMAMVSHDLANPLTAIRGMASTLRRRDVSIGESTRQDMLEAIERESIRLTDMAQDVMRNARLGDGTLTYSFAPLDVATVADRCARLGGQMSRVHDVAFERAGDTVLDGDEARLQEVLLNLIDNGIKYSPQGGTISMRVRGDGDHVRVTVADQGVGLTKDQAARVFDRMVRIHTEETKGIPGTGLGLYIVRRIVEDHGGRVWAEGRPGKGSTFTMEFPRERPQTGPAGASDEKGSREVVPDPDSPSQAT